MSNSSILAAIDTAIEAIITGTAAHVTVAGVTYSALDLDKLRLLRQHYASLVAADGAASGKRAWAISPLQSGDAK